MPNERCLVGVIVLFVVYKVLMYSRWDFLDRQPRIRIRIICLLEGPAGRQFNGGAFEGRHICTRHVSHDTKHAFSKATLVMQLQRNADDVLKRWRLHERGPNNTDQFIQETDCLASATPLFFEIRAMSRNFDGHESSKHRLKYQDVMTVILSPGATLQDTNAVTGCMVTQRLSIACGGVKHTKPAVEQFGSRPLIRRAQNGKACFHLEVELPALLILFIHLPSPPMRASPPMKSFIRPASTMERIYAA
jgi:hypothetical protein